VCCKVVNGDDLWLLTELVVIPLVVCVAFSIKTVVVVHFVVSGENNLCDELDTSVVFVVILSVIVAKVDVVIIFSEKNKIKRDNFD